MYLETLYKTIRVGANFLMWQVKLINIFLTNQPQDGPLFHSARKTLQTVLETSHWCNTFMDHSPGETFEKIKANDTLYTLI